MVVGLYYYPPSDINSLPLLDLALQDLHPSHPVVLLGDFNVNLLPDHKNSPLSLTLLEIASKYNLTQLVNEPTRSVGSSSSLIDHVYSSDPSLCSSCWLIRP